MNKVPALSSRQQYYELIQHQNHKLDDVLKDVPELSYSQKLEIIEELLKEHAVASVREALLIYKRSYIDIGKVDLRIVKNVLDGLCVISRIYEEKKEKKIL